MKQLARWSVVLCALGCGNGSKADAGLDDAGSSDAADVSDGTTDGAEANDGAADVPPPPRVCRPGSVWTPGTVAVEDTSTDWGLHGVMGTGLATADVDGDGWLDLVVMRPGYERGNGRLFLNRPGAGGHRTFVEHTAESGLFRIRGSDEDGRQTSLVTFGDLDNDGDEDAFVDTFAYPPTGVPYLADGPEILLNDGTGTFTMTADPEITGPAHPLASAGFFFDQDLDGRLDLFVGYWWKQPVWTLPWGDPPQLFRGDGAGGFTDVTADVGMLLVNSGTNLAAGTNARPLFGATICDVNGDGRIDIVGAAYARFYNELFLADGDRFSEVGPATGVGADDRLDYTDDESFRCYCQTTPSAPDCSGVPAPSAGYPCPGRGWYPGQSDQPYDLGGNTYSHACGDFDNDGDFDLYESSIRHPDTGSSSDPSELLVNESAGGTVHFARPGREGMGLTPPINLARVDEGGQNSGMMDFDNDGRLDAYLGGSPYACNRSWLFHQKAEGTLQFEWVERSSQFYHPCADGMALGDFDHDGDEDIIVGTYGCNDATTVGLPCGADWRPADNQPVEFYENVSNENNWISIKLVGRGAGGANRSGIGATVKLTAGGVTQMRLVHGTGGAQLSRDPVAFFGLGATCDIDRIEVRWPNAGLTTQTFTGVLANYRVELREGDATVRYLP